MARTALKTGSGTVGTVFIVVAIALNVPIGLWMIADGETARGYLQLCVGAFLIGSGLDFHRRAAR